MCNATKPNGEQKSRFNISATMMIWYEAHSNNKKSVAVDSAVGAVLQMGWENNEGAWPMAMRLVNRAEPIELQSRLIQSVSGCQKPTRLRPLLPNLVVSRLLVKRSSEIVVWSFYFSTLDSSNEAHRTKLFCQVRFISAAVQPKKASSNDWSNRVESKFVCFFSLVATNLTFLRLDNFG